MEGDYENGNGNSTSLSSNSRWNPTKEQVSMLESLYAQGIRTPSAEQIQQMTARLRAFGHIEGKNVFYWFQNHKARQRQKQKQERIALINRYLHSNPASAAASLFPPTNVVCGSYCFPRNDLGLYPQRKTKLLVPDTGGSKRRAAAIYNVGLGRGSDVEQQEYNIMMHTNNIKNDRFINNSSDDTMMMIGCNNQETLPLFPVHPTGILQDKTTTTATTYTNTMLPSDHSCSTSSSSCTVKEDSEDQPFFDFFSAD